MMYRPSQIGLFFTATLLSLMPLGCAPSGDDEARAQQTQEPTSAQAEGPQQIILAFYTAANEGRYEDAKLYFSEEGLGHLEGPLGALAGGIKGLLDEYTRDGTLENVDVGEVQIRGDGASCTVSKQFADSSVETLPIEFIKEDGAWKIAWSTPTL